MRKQRINVRILFLLFHLLSLLLLSRCIITSNITLSNPLLQGQTITSPDQNFELGFFTPTNFSNQYVGIWYKDVSPQKVVWVANREKPVLHAPASLQIGKDGDLRLVDGKQETIWSAGVGHNLINESIAILIDGGNFILKEFVSSKNLWESSQHPSDTLLPGKWTFFNKNHMNRSLLTSWKSENDPSPGDFHVAFSSESPPQFFIWKGLKPYWRSGLWDKSKFIGISEMSETYKSQYMITLDDPNQGIISITFREVDGCIFSNLVISSTGELNSKCFVTSRGWKSTCHAPETRSKIIYGTCGPFGVFKGSEELTCSCLKGFVPMSPQEWSTGNWARGCRRRVELHCESNSTTSHQNSQSDGFLKMSNLKLPDFSIFMETSIADTLCMQWCLKNCSCIAYAFVKGIGCLVWDRDLIDMLEFSSGGQDLFVRLDHSELGEHYPLILIISLVSLSSFIILIAAAFSLYMWRPYQKLIERDANNSYRHKMSVEQLLVEKEPLNLPMYDLDSILLATNNFSSAKKLGQGGYGPVYKGKLADGKDVAIKRLSSNSGQGIEEFRNEIKLISKLQHRNLVKIVGCCIDKEEKILIYEFMPNKSLDTYLFDQTNRTELDWHQRFNIILGIARGILYLHRDSCLRVIHRDLKASNILLDKKMNPKISDFGLARMFEGTLDLINTFRVVGTLGYMSPEYALSGLFSEKSDIFSFGVLLLEIISGKKITSFHYNEEYLGLVSYAWQSWCENGGLSMIDEALSGSISLSQATRCVNIGLLCVQDHAADRPSISAVVSMLSDDNAILSQPNKPMFFFQSVLRHHAEPEGRCVLSINQVTESILEGR